MPLASIKGKPCQSVVCAHLRVVETVLTIAPRPNNQSRTRISIYDKVCPRKWHDYSLLSLLLPPASQRLVKLNERQTLVELGLHQVEFR
jgi:hypothetical protein